MDSTKQDLYHCQNLIKALRKGTFNLEGLEVLALSDAMRWLGKLEAVLSAPKPEEVQKAEPMTIKEVKNPITLPAKVPKVSKERKK